MLREAKKEALPYRRHAIQALGQVAEALQSDIFPAIYEMLQPLFETKEDEMEEEEKEETAQREMLDLHEAAVLALGRAFSSDATAQGMTVTSIDFIFWKFEYLWSQEIAGKCTCRCCELLQSIPRARFSCPLSRRCFRWLAE